MRVELSVRALYRLLHRENLGEPHTLFTGGERYYSPRFRQEDDAALRRELDAAGVNTARGVDPAFLEMLSVVQRAGVEYYGYFHDAEGPYAVVAAAVGRNAVLAQRVEQAVTFELVDAQRLLESFIYRLPNVPPGRGEAVSVRLADLAQPKQEGFQMRAGATGSPHVRRLQAMMRAERRGGAKLYAARRDHHGRRTRAANWIDVLDLPDGRWAVYKTTGRGEPSVMVTPGTPQLIATRLRELNQEP